MTRSIAPATRAVQRITLVLALLAAPAACASKQSADPSAGGALSTQPSRYHITAEELSHAQANDLYDAVLKLRPQFIKGRGETLKIGKVSMPPSTRPGGAASAPSSPTPSGDVGTALNNPPQPVIAYRDGVRLSDIDEMRQVPLSSVFEVRYLAGPDAVIRYGTDHAGGVILITTKQ